MFIPKDQFKIGGRLFDGQIITEMKAKAEYTDTYAGEANYSWCRKCEVEGKSTLSIVRQVKASFGLTGIRCRRYQMDGEIWLYPSGMCRVVFIYLG